MRNMTSFWFLLILLIAGANNILYSQSEDIYDSGTVWSVTFIRTGANSTNDYLKGLKNTWDAIMKEAVNEGLIKSYKILLGVAANKEDFNIILMVENENMAALDPNPERREKMQAIQKSIKEKMGDKFDETVGKYDNIRDLFGSKLMREITLK
jgi:hypothetical protein